ncbi:pyruvate kinase [Candidatus Aerophobetes bacterium]|uniref:Pyruvate kinase n=1 Tax=Aerophobetes bacterium TaxID=2030807 RepID=A0A2A4X9K5_UNCAE|nr:MAG: pyruvate kinase [Candidatus Aerophobetes bacterium]
MKIKTKVVVTLGPATNSYEMVEQLVCLGMDVARINMSHGEYEEHRQTIAWLKKARKKLGKPLAIMLDTKGPELRVGKISGGSIELKEGDEVELGEKSSSSKSVFIPLDPAHIIKEIPVKATVLFDDGYIETCVVETLEKSVKLKVLKGGSLKSQKGINIPGVSLSLPALTERDKEDIASGISEDIDIVAASFIRSAKHVESILDWMRQKGGSDTLLLAKIESAEGVANFDAILEKVDGIMVARGDLGVELPLTQVPQLQKMMIRKCYKAFKPVITATQMLETMIDNTRPTRAEVSDVANAIYDLTSAVMLSGETAIGKHPLQTIKMMQEIIFEAEQNLKLEEFFQKEAEKSPFSDSSHAIAIAAVKTSYILKSSVIVAVTSSGYCPNLIARFRPAMPILAITMREKVFNQMAFFWGVLPHLCSVKDICSATTEAKKIIKEAKLAHSGSVFVITTGTPFGKKGSTNSIILEKAL